jgi:hypothetical protein
MKFDEKKAIRRSNMSDGMVGREGAWGIHHRNWEMGFRSGEKFMQNFRKRR